MAAGFVGFEITWRKDVFGGAPQAGSAENFGTLGINFRARKARDEEELAASLAARSCEIPNNSTGGGMTRAPIEAEASRETL